MPRRTRWYVSPGVFPSNTEAAAVLPASRPSSAALATSGGRDLGQAAPRLQDQQVAAPI